MRNHSPEGDPSMTDARVSQYFTDASYASLSNDTPDPPSLRPREFLQLHRSVIIIKMQKITLSSRSANTRHKSNPNVDLLWLKLQERI